jgi:hypothetical protein
LANLILLTTLTILLSSFESNIEYLMLWTILSAALRVIGHFFEPLPPFLMPFPFYSILFLFFSFVFSHFFFFVFVFFLY